MRKKALAGKRLNRLNERSNKYTQNFDGQSQILLSCLRVESTKKKLKKLIIPSRATPMRKLHVEEFKKI